MFPENHLKLNILYEVSSCSYSLFRLYFFKSIFTERRTHSHSDSTEQNNSIFLIENRSPNCQQPHNVYKKANHPTLCFSFKHYLFIWPTSSALTAFVTIASSLQPSPFFSKMAANRVTSLSGFPFSIARTCKNDISGREEAHSILLMSPSSE